MFHPAASLHPRKRPQELLDESLGLLLGCAFTLGLFSTIAHFDKPGATHPDAEIQEVRQVSLPLEPPPPPPVLTPPVETVAADVALSGIEIGESDSAIKIAVVPPDLEAIIPNTAYVPARTPLTTLHNELRPATEVDLDVRRVYQESEVDQRPRAIIRTAPVISAEIQGGAAALRVGLLLLINEKGKVVDARVLQSSGKPAFDDIVARCVKNEWLFSPAVRRGKKVRVLAEQGFRVNFGNGGSPFSLD